MLSYITYVMVCYLTCVMLCYKTYLMLYNMLCCLHMLYDICYTTYVI